MRFINLFIVLLTPVVQGFHGLVIDSFQVKMKIGNKQKFECHGVVMNPDNVVFPASCEPNNKNFNIYHNNKKLEILKKTSNKELTIYEINGIKGLNQPLFASEQFPYEAIGQELNFINYNKGRIIEKSIKVVNNNICRRLFNMENYDMCLGTRNQGRRKNCRRDKGKALYLDTYEGIVLSGMVTEGCPHEMKVTKAIKFRSFSRWMQVNGGPLKQGPNVCPNNKKNKK
jgi:hypothetical protein